MCKKSHGKAVGHNHTVELPLVQQPSSFRHSVAPVPVHEALAGEPLRHLGVDLSDLLVAIITGHDVGHCIPPLLGLFQSHGLGQDPPREVTVRVFLGRRLFLDHFGQGQCN